MGNGPAELGGCLASLSSTATLAAWMATASVRTAGFETGLCLAGSEHLDLPVPGNIISGTVFLTAAVDARLS
jgi:hypothetical protein